MFFAGSKKFMGLIFENRPIATASVATKARMLKQIKAASVARIEFSVSDIHAHDRALGIVAVAWLITAIAVLVLVIATVIRAFF
jgi:hypothetical protein